MKAGDVVADRYEIVRQIGAGGFGVVYEARNVALGSTLALKCLLPGRREQSGVVMRFLREARAAATVQHPNVVYVFDVGWIGDREIPYFAMELLDGHSLAEELATTGALPPARAVAIACQVLDALSAAHARNVIHRDLKPDNVFLTRHAGGEQVKILDFGISKILDDEVGLTAVGFVIGTPSHMSPEQARGGTLDHRTDVYGLGTILYEMLAGRAPFRAGGGPVADLLKRIATTAPTPLAALRPDLDPALVAVVERALRKDPAERWTNAAAMRAALERTLIEAEPVTTQHVCAPEERPSLTTVLYEDDLESLSTELEPERGEHEAPTQAHVLPRAPAGRRPPFVVLAVSAAALVAVLGLVALLSGGDDVGQVPVAEAATLAPVFHAAPIAEAREPMPEPPPIAAPIPEPPVAAPSEAPAVEEVPATPVHHVAARRRSPVLRASSVPVDPSPVPPRSSHVLEQNPFR